MQRVLVALGITVLLALGQQAFAANDVQQKLSAAKAGETITLPEGTITGGLTVPAGVSLKGAGVGKTIIEASGSVNGVTVEGGSSSVVSDLTVIGAKGAGVAVKGAQSATVSRVRATGCGSGFLLSKSVKSRVENCIADNGSFGAVISGGSDNVIVNCTIAGCIEMGISLGGTKNAVIFNNCVVGSGICLNIDKPSNLKSDHNLYFGFYVAQMSDQIVKKQLTAWQYLTAEDGTPGLDLHSVQMPVDFKDAKGGDFTPVTVLTWALDRAVTAEWGAAEFAGVKAPETDISGKARAGRVDVGAVEAAVQAPRSADGQFTVTKDEGAKSAGVFTKDGMLVSYLFQNLPLPSGTYSFWLPSRNYVGQVIPAGEYEVRLAESDFKWKFLSTIGDTGGACAPGGHTASANPKFVTFADNKTVVVLEGLSESHTTLRAYDVATGAIKWYLHGGGSAQGLTMKDGTIYFLYQADQAKGTSRLTRVDTATGKVKPWPGADTGHLFPVTGPDSHSMTALGDRLYVANAGMNKLTAIKIADGTVDKDIAIASPRFVAGDDKNNVLWVISGDTVVAIDANGKQLAQSTAVPDPAAVAACNGKLAIASHKTGKIHYFDAADVADLKPAGELGKGDGPYGKAEPDRFLFQKGQGWDSKSDDCEASMVINSDGQLAVTDAKRRVSMFDRDGKNLWFTYGVFGNQMRPSHSTGNKRAWDCALSTSFLLDEKAGTWQLENVWDFSAIAPSGLRTPRLAGLGDFMLDGKTFFVATGGDADPRKGALMVSRLDGFKAVPVLVIAWEDGKLLSRKDTNGDGKITKDDAAEVVVGPEGKPLPEVLFPWHLDLQADGSIVIIGKPGSIWKCTGLDSSGVPVYDGKNYLPIPTRDWATSPTPYDCKPEGVTGFMQIGFLSDGGYIGQARVRGSCSTGLNPGAGTDLCGYDREGRLRWVHQMAQFSGIAGMGTVDDITVAPIGYTMEVQVVDGDGLGLGAFCESPKLHYPGYWIDHPNVRLFKLPDGNIYMTNGDNASGRHPWYRLENRQSLLKKTQAFSVSPERAAELAALEFKISSPPVWQQPQIKIPRLAGPMKIDGDLEKWRKAGVQPQIVIGPSGKLQGPGDLSAIIRLAYEANNLYVQVLSFDDVPVFGNSLVWQNSVEMAINGVYPNGMQFVACKAAGNKDIIWRNRFFDNNVKQLTLDPAKAPCVVKVLDDATGVPEREMIERLYGEDLSKAKVIITEFMIPMDKTTYQGTEQDVPELGPGKQFRVNFFVDDSDTPYTDAQELIGWPIGCGMFGSKEDAALATCE